MLKEATIFILVHTIKKYIKYVFLFMALNLYIQKQWKVLFANLAYQLKYGLD